MKQRNLLSRVSSFACLQFLAVAVLSLAWSGIAPGKEVDENMPLAGITTSIQPDLFSGALTASIPIQVPPGRNGMQPNLNLAYWSGSGNGWMGQGWKMELGAIERRSSNYSSDDYVFRLGGASTILTSTGGNEYRAKVEGSFDRIRKLTATDGKPYFEATDKKGTRYLFGQTPASRIADPADANRVFRWCLDWIVDRDGNYVRIVYWQDSANAQSYLDEIRYAGFSSNGEESGTTLAPVMTVKFYRDEGNRPDTSDIYLAGFRVRTAYRLKAIDVQANSQRIRAYKFGYTTSTNTSHSLLSSILQYGKDAVVDGSGNVTGTPLPGLSLSYQAGGPSSFVNAGSWVADTGSSDVRVGDVNGDGKADLVAKRLASVALSTGSGFSGWTNWLPGFCELEGEKWGVGDFDGDGKTDIFCDDAYSSNTVYVALSTGTSFSSPTAWGQSGWVPFPTTCNAAFGDFNGDGKTDRMCWDSWNGGKFIVFSTGSSFAQPVLWPGFDGCDAATGDQMGVGDFNGDSRTDVYCRRSYTAGDFKVFLSTGTGFVDAGSWVLDTGYSDVSSGDINGDGRVDLIAQSTVTMVALSTGSGFTGWSSWPSGNFCGWIEEGMQRGFGDFNGDGRTDIYCRYPYSSADFKVALADPAASVPDLLTSVANGLGSNTTIAYTQYASPPLFLQIVSSIITTDGNGNAATTAYVYSGGYFHRPEQDFRGFNYAKATGPIGPNGEQVINETWFHQGNDIAVDASNPNVSDGYMKGKPYRLKATNGAGTVLTETTTSYAADADGAAPFFTPPTQVDTNICDGTGCGKQTRIVYTHDSYGNVTREDHYGDLADGSDDRTVVYTFALNTADWLVGLPATESVYEGIGTSNQVSTTTFYYDGTASCATASTNQTPTQGHVTRLVRWLSGRTSPETRMAYDSYGNRICTRDANGNVTTVTYDSSATFARIVTNPLGHQATTQYYGVDGVAMDAGFYGQIKQMTDSNGATTTRTYDNYGRLMTVTNPGGFWSTRSYNGLGAVGSQHVRTDNAQGLSTWVYFDGLGHTIKHKQSGPDGKIIVTDSQYNGRGAILRTSLPYFEGIGSPLWQTPTYDPLGRIVRTDLPDGTRTLACYDDWVQVGIDQNNHRRRETRDVYGRLVRVDEYQGAFTSCDTSVGSPYATTTYQYDVLGNLRFVNDAKGNRTEMQYDTLGRKTLLKDPDMGTWSYVYDSVGNLLQQTDPMEETTYFKYDVLNRLLQKDFCVEKPLGSGDVVYTYDGTVGSGKGRLASVLDASGTTSLVYDLSGQITRTDKTVDGTTYTTQMAYDGLGRLTSVTYPDASVVNYAFNGPLLQRAYEGGTNYAEYSGHNALGQPATLTLGNGVATTYSYQANTFRLASLTTVKDSTTLQSLSYTYDNNSNVTALTDAINGNQSFGYDDLNRLTSATGPYGSLSYAYDQIGNMTNNSQVGSYTYPDSGTTSIRPHAVTTAGTNSYTYDANGNMTAGAGRTMVYDYENRPTSITHGGQTTTFVYDGDGGRVKKVIGGSTTTYIGKLYECETVSGATQCVKYIFAGPQRVAMKQVVNGTVDYYHTDHLGSTSVMTTAAGTHEEGLTYYPYGAVRTNTGTINVPYKYTGQELDASTGLNFYSARYYDANLGRFISADTIVPDPGDPQSLNRYAYARNNPLLYSDPTGHFILFGLEISWVQVAMAVGMSTISSGISSDWDPEATITGAAIGGASNIAAQWAGQYVQTQMFSAPPPTITDQQLLGAWIVGFAPTVNATGDFVGAVTSGLASGGLNGLRSGNLSSALAGAGRGAMGAAIGGMDDLFGLSAQTLEYKPVTLDELFGDKGAIYMTAHAAIGGVQGLAMGALSGKLDLGGFAQGLSAGLGAAGDIAKGALVEMDNEGGLFKKLFGEATGSSGPAWRLPHVMKGPGMTDVILSATPINSFFHHIISNGVHLNGAWGRDAQRLSKSLGVSLPDLDRAAAGALHRSLARQAGQKLEQLAR